MTQPHLDLRLHENRYTPSMTPGPESDAAWDAKNVRGLRAHLGVSQAEFAERIGTRQQTISEWETGTRAPRRMSRRLLRLVAEASGYYDATSTPKPTEDGPA